ncbi:hypothetical protein FB451DRAFT_1389301 [Mycena latifolia]|nr:hypothetical protein FB451DRAFT_1389301 [Mycena latifolia]
MARPKAASLCSFPIRFRNSPFYLPFAELASLHPAKFDVILLDPPFSASFTWAHLQELPGPALAADPSFVLMWSAAARPGGASAAARTSFASLLTRTKQHCLIGIRGTVRWEGDAGDPTRKPPEILSLADRSSPRRGWVTALAPRMGGMGPIGMDYRFGGGLQQWGAGGAFEGY